MSVKDAVAERFLELCRKKGIKINELANRSGVTPSTAYSMLDPKRREISITTIKNSAMGLISRSASSFPPRFSTASSRRYTDPLIFSPAYAILHIISKGRERAE